MSLNRNEKEAVIAEVAAQAGKSQTLALAEYRGLTVAQLDQLRKNARAQGVYLHVLKNTLARRAVAGTQFEVAAESMSGPLIYGFSEDAVAAAKVIADFAKGNDKLVIKAGAFAGKALDANGVPLPIVDELGLTTSKDVLLAVGDGGGPEQVFVTLGYAGWEAGQLEKEIAQNSWLTVEADPKIIFDLPADERYDAALALLGIDFAMLSEEAGHA